MTTRKETGETAAPGRIPEIPQEFVDPGNEVGAVPADCAAGYEVTRIQDTPEARGAAKSMCQLVVHAGDRNPDNPTAPLIRNEEMFGRTPDGELTYRGDLLVVWKTSVAESCRTRCAERAKRASADGVRSSKTNLKGAPFTPPEMAGVV